MRQIGHLPTETAARSFGDYLYVHGIENQVEDDQPAGWAVWVSEEDKIDRAVELLTAFRANPQDPKYMTQGKEARQLRVAKEKSDEAYRKKMLTRRQLFRPLTAYGFGPLTLTLIVISVAVFILEQMDSASSLLSALFISAVTDPSLPEVRSGQVWRLVTPIFIHFGILHIFFNMLWLRDLGSMIEARQSSLQLGLLVLAIAIGSNLAQFLIDKSPLFGGMSGVVYGLLGYVWIRGKFDPASGLLLHPTTVMMMMIWFVICFAGWMGHVANWAHAGGLVIGMAWGYSSSLRSR